MRVHPKMSIISKAVVPGASAQVTVRQMTSARKSAEIAAAALAKMLRDSNDSGRVADIVESVLTDANREQEEQERRHVAEVEAAAATRLTRLLDASPAVIYSFEAKGDFAPTFVSENIARLFGYAASEYLDNPNFWRERVHPDDLPRLEAEMSALFERGQHVCEYRFRKKDGGYCWVNDDQHLIRDEAGEPSEVVGSWSDISARKGAEEAEDRARARLALLLDTAPAVIYSFKASGDYAPTFVSDNIKRLLGYCPDDISRMRISGAPGYIPTISRASRPSRRRCSSAIATPPNTASAKRTATIAGSATNSI